MCFRLFEDVAPVLQQLAEEDFMLYIYSSGSVEAQKLLLSHSTDGDITDVSYFFIKTYILYFHSSLYALVGLTGGDFRFNLCPVNYVHHSDKPS